MDAKELGKQPAHPTDMEGTIAGGFPSAVDGYTSMPGLTKREAFMLAAMQGIAANPQCLAKSTREFAEWALKQADACLAELAKAQTL